MRLLVACCVSGADGLRMGAVKQVARLECLPRSRPVALSSQDPDERDDATKMEDDKLAAAFAARLEKEGGATQFKMKTTVSDAADAVKSAADKAKDLAGGLPSPAEASAGQLLAGLAAISILFTVANAAGRGSDSIDRYSSDGTTLEFGQRSQNRQLDRVGSAAGGSSYFGLEENPFRAQLGEQSGVQ